MRLAWAGLYDGILLSPGVRHETGDADSFLAESGGSVEVEKCVEIAVGVIVIDLWLLDGHDCICLTAGHVSGFLSGWHGNLQDNRRVVCKLFDSGVNARLCGLEIGIGCSFGIVDCTGDGVGECSRGAASLLELSSDGAGREVKFNL